MASSNVHRNLTQITGWTPHIFAIGFAFLLHSFLKWLFFRRSMPPGPLGVPLIGNYQQLPSVKPWLKFSEWTRQYGPVISLFLGSTSVIVLGTAQAAWDLLEKRSEIYSSRPRFIVASEILSGGHRGLMRPYDDKWRKWRKLLHSGFHYRMAQSYRDIQSLESVVMMWEILQDPKHYERHFQRFASSSVTSIVYGSRINSMDEWIITEFLQIVRFFTSAAIPGRYPVDSWPWLLKLPRRLQWFRGAVEERRKRDEHFLMTLFHDVETKMKTGSVPDCLTSQAIADRVQNGMTDLEIAYAVSSPFGAATETTVAALVTFILAMLHFPAVMSKAQSELDRIVGRDRIPEFNDRDNLPYINALISETLRWRPVTPLGGAPHAVIVDDEYNGMFIPKGSTIYANTFGIMHDQAMFASPNAFQPERFLESSDPRLKTFDLPFGFGRRICPGMHLARNSLFIVISRLLWSFDILPALSDDGKEVIPDSWNYTDAFVTKPVSFDCRMVPRNAAVIACLRAEWESAKERLGGRQ